MSTGRGRKRALDTAGRGRRRFLAWTGFALLGLSHRRWCRFLPSAKAPLRGREARWYRRVR